MSELRSAIESLRAEELASLPDARIEEDYTELRRVAEQLELETLRRVAELERRRTFERDGHLSAASWLVGAHRVAPGAAREQVRTARALREMPATRAAVESGDVPLSAARALVTAREVDPEAFGRAERQLVEAARVHSVVDLRRVVSYWRQTMNATAPRIRRRRSATGAPSTPRSPSAGWSASTATSIPRRARR